MTASSSRRSAIGPPCRPIADRRELLAVIHAGEEDLPRADELELHVSELDDVPGLDDSPPELGGVHAHAVGRALVDDLETPVSERVDFAVQAGDRVVVDR